MKVVMYSQKKPTTLLFFLIKVFVSLKVSSTGFMFSTLGCCLGAIVGGATLDSSFVILIFFSSFSGFSFFKSLGVSVFQAGFSFVLSFSISDLIFTSSLIVSFLGPGSFFSVLGLSSIFFSFIGSFTMGFSTFFSFFSVAASGLVTSLSFFGTSSFFISGSPLFLLVKSFSFFSSFNFFSSTFLDVSLFTLGSFFFTCGSSFVLASSILGGSSITFGIGVSSTTSSFGANPDSVVVSSSISSKSGMTGSL